LQVERLEAVPPLTGQAAASPALPAAWDFHPEAAPYQVSFPSRVATPPEEKVTSFEALSPQEGDAARLRGEVTHRALLTLAQGGPLPETASLTAALRQAGMAAAAAAALAPEIRAELNACLADPFLAALLRPDRTSAASEWLLEDQPQPGTIRRGIMDRLAYDGSHWWLLDYKTSRPAEGEDWDSFLVQEVAKYRPQLLAYREMAAKAKGIEPPEAIRLGIYFTACQRVVEV
jgi:ATP-dependent helicase/nuclease subunit A